MDSLSHLGSTWLIDLDGTITAHNSHLSTGDSILPGVVDLWASFNKADRVIILTAREERFRAATQIFLESHGLRCDALLMGLSKGARILVNDRKPDGTPTAYCVNLERDRGPLSVLDMIKTGI